MTARKNFFAAAFAAIFLLLPSVSEAAAMYKPFEISGWIPYWRGATGTADALQHLDVFTEINPFGYSVKLNGTLYDAAKLGEEPWLSLQKAAQQKKIRYIPTVMWANGEAIHRILSKQKTRIALEDEITTLVKKNGFDGIDIDFEGKYAKTKDYFSTFLKGLQMRLGSKKWLMCTIESRTPLADRYFGTTPPKDAGMYANDFVAINKYCDRVRIMAYDQRTADQTLNKKYKAIVYTPLADTAWVEKSIKLAMKQINKKKIVIGVATYGDEYRVGGSVGNYEYQIQWAFNPRYADQIASAYGVTPARTAWGEMGLAYVPTTTQTLIGADVMPALPMPGETGSNVRAAAATTSSNNLQTAFRYLVWSDAKAIADKIALAKKLGVRGVAIFKIDGGEDPAMWDLLK